MWQFNQLIAERFQHEAETNIPDYARVVSICLNYANEMYKKDITIIDVGSALGYTMNTFIQAGYDQVYGVESSKDMLDKSLYPANVFYTNVFPNMKCDLVLMNWTLHFIKEKESYLKSIYDQLNTNGTLILTDKTTQMEPTKNLYYQFKHKKGVSYEYIFEKEKMLENVIYTKTTEWYLKVLTDIGFKVDILNARYGFVTLLCLT